MIFVDTSLWYAAHVAEEPKHQESRQLLLANASGLLTSDYVVDELLTLLSVRGHRNIAERIGDDFWSEKVSRLHWSTRDDVAAAWRVFTTFNDKTWSFTDCVSYAVMKQLGIDEAFALDDHFRQFGFVRVLPE